MRGNSSPKLSAGSTGCRGGVLMSRGTKCATFSWQPGQGRGHQHDGHNTHLKKVGAPQSSFFWVVISVLHP